jgi:hypothetical protein
MATTREAPMLTRFALLVIGLPLAVTGVGLTAAFGIFAFIGMPLLAIGLSCVSAAFDPRS